MGTRRTGIYEEEGQLFRPLTPSGNGAGILGDIHRASNQICGIYIYIIQLYSSCLLLFTDSFLVHSFVRSFIHLLIYSCLFIRGVCIYRLICLFIYPQDITYLSNLEFLGQHLNVQDLLFSIAMVAITKFNGIVYKKFGEMDEHRLQHRSCIYSISFWFWDTMFCFVTEGACI